MPGLYKIGFTRRAIEERLQEANQPNTWIPTPFLVEFSKFVEEPQKKESTLHKILVKQRVNPNREFFRVDVDQVRLLFDLMDTIQTIAEPEADSDARLIGDEVIRLFLDSFVYPAFADDEPVPWQKIEALFKTWKRENGYTAGNAMKLREMLIEVYGKPNRGEGWNSFRLKM